MYLQVYMEGPHTFSVTRDWEFYFSVIHDSWYKSILCPCELEFWLFCEREILFWISRDAWKGQIILCDSVIRRGIGGPPCTWHVYTSIHVCIQQVHHSSPAHSVLMYYQQATLITKLCWFHPAQYMKINFLNIWSAATKQRKRKWYVQATSNILWLAWLGFNLEYEPPVDSCF